MQANLLTAMLEESECWAVTLPWLQAVRRQPIMVSLDQQAAETRRAAKLPKVQGGIGIVPISGVITQKSNWLMEYFGGSSSEQIAAQIERFQADPAIGATVLDIHSPGGSAYGIWEAGERIFAASQRSGGSKPIIAVANSLAASAAFHLFSAADKRYVTTGGDVGSVGIYAMHVDWSKMNEQMGVSVTYIAEPPAKVEGNPDQPLSPEALERMQESVHKTYEMFVKELAKFHGITPAKVKADFGQGRVLDAVEAKSAGMVDGVKTFGDVLRELGGTKTGEQKPSSRMADVGVRRRALALKVKPA